MSQIKSEDITLNHLKILKAVDDCGSFSKAAQKLGYSQALISKKVKQIEDYFGVLLLNRSPGSIELTNQGRKLISQTFNVIETIENLQEEFQITLSAENEDLTLAATPLILEIWLKRYLRRFQLCFPGRTIKEISVQTGTYFSDSPEVSLDLLLNSSSAYDGKHHCTRLTTHQMMLISFGANEYPHGRSPVRFSDINLARLVLLDEVYQELSKSKFLLKQLSEVPVFERYQDLLKYAFENQKLTILPDFCQSDSMLNDQAVMLLIQDVNEYGIYLHVPRFSELLVSGEGLVRSFRLDQDDLESSPTDNPILSNCISSGNVLRVGIQRDSIGQFIAGYGVKHISDLQRTAVEQTIFKDIEIDRNFELQIFAFASGEQMNQQMKKGNLDICLLDDISLLNNGTCFFNDLTFGSKLIAIASYNFLGQDISIILPRGSTITAVQELEGKRISTLFGSNAHRFIVTLFNLCGLEVGKDCRLVNEDFNTASMSLLNKNIDAHVCCDTFALVLEDCGFARKLPLDQKFGLKIPSLRGIVCRSQFVKENPKFVIAYLHDLVIANYWFNSDPENAIKVLSELTGVRQTQIAQFFDPASGNRIDPTLKPQWSWLLKTLNRRLEGKYGISLFDVDFWMDDYFLRLVYSLLDLDYHFHQISFSSELSSSYFLEEKFNRHMKVFYDRHIPPSDQYDGYTAASNGRQSGD
jgi:molybdate transport repressor ModE-like protein